MALVWGIQTPSKKRGLEVCFFFSSAQFLINGFTTYRYDRNRIGGSMLLYIREDIPLNLLGTDDIIEGFYIEIS